MKKSILFFLFSVFFLNITSHAQWQKVNTLHGGNCTSLVADDSILYASIFNDHIYRSFDNGLNWDTISAETRRILTADNGLLIAYTPSKSSYMYSTDSGNTWVLKMFPIPYGNSVSIERCQGVLFFNNGSLLKTSADTGKTWKQRYTTNGNLTIQRSSGSMFLFDYNLSELKTTSDTGKTWYSIGSNLALNKNLQLCKYGDTLVVLADTGVYVTTNFGVSWIKKSAPTLFNINIRIYFLDSDIIYVNNNSIYKSTDIADSWQSVPYNPPHMLNGILVKSGAEIFVNSPNLGVENIDLITGNTSARNTGFNGVPVGNLFVAGDSIFVVAFAGGPAILFYSYDNALTWDYTFIGNNGAQSMTIDQNKILYFAGNNSFYKSTDGAKSWQLTGTYPATYIRTNNIIARDSLIYCATQYGLYTIDTALGSVATLSNLTSDEYFDVDLFDNSIITVSDSGVFSSAITPPYSWLADTFGIPSPNNFTSLAVNDTVVFATATTGVFRKGASANIWTRIGMFGQHPGKIKTNSNGDAFIFCDKGVATYNTATNKWNVINYGLPRYNGKVYINKLAVNDKSLYVTDALYNTVGLWQRSMSIVLALGINDPQPQSEMINAYPNPATTDVTVTLNAAASQNYTLAVLDVPGRICSKQKLNLQGGAEQTIDISNLENGCYVFQFVNGNTAINKKIMVQH